MVEFKNFCFNVRYLAFARFERNGERGIIKIGVLSKDHYEEYIQEYNNWTDGDSDFYILLKHINYEREKSA